MSNIKYLFFILISLLGSSCAFNNRFHNPSKAPIKIEEIPSFSLGKDTIFLDFNSKTKQLNLFKKNNVLINSSFSIKFMMFKSESGNNLNAWLLKPKKTTPKATIVHFHGSASNLLFSHYEAISPLIDYGFQIITFDYSGYGFSEGKATRKNALKDSYSFLDFVKNLEDTKDSKLILYGQSYGGYLATIVGSNRQDVINGMVIEGAFTNHRAEAKYESPFWGNLVKNEKFAEKEVRNNHKPILIVHSNEDKRVPLKFGKKIFENANQPKEFYEIDKPHIFGLQYYSKEIASKIDSLILKNNYLEWTN